MPFINGRYYINPVLGAGTEQARTAEEARNRSAALADGPPDQDADFWQDAPQRKAEGESGPIHQIHIEATEIVPSHSGRAARGYVARIQRAPSVGGLPANLRVDGEKQNRRSQAGATPLRPATHVFTDHRDLLNFLLHELSEDHSRT